MGRAAAKVILQTPEPVDGSALYVYELAVALAEAGVPVTLYCPANFDYLTPVYAAGIPVVKAPVRPVSRASFGRRLWRNVAWVATTAALQWRITKAGDIVHFEHLLHFPLGLVFLLAARLKGAHIVLKAHDPVPHKWRLPVGLHWLERKMLKWGYALCSVVVVHNQVGRSILMQECQYASDRIAVIPHGPLAPAPARAEYPAMDVLRLLLFGAIRENKGVHLAIEAIQGWAEGPGRRVHLTIAGPVNAAYQDYWTNCREQISRAPERIEIIEGFIADSDVPALFARHHAALMPYTDFFSESGVSSLALSNERPLIATGAGGLAELLEASQGGILIDSPSIESIREAIGRAFELGRDGLRQMGRVGGTYQQEIRSWRTIAQSTKLLYARLGSAPSSTKPSSTPRPSPAMEA